jgi:maltose-binding protein MalE
MDVQRRILVSQLLGVVIASILTVGCSDPAKPAPAAKNKAAPATAIQLTVLVAGDDELAEGVRLLRGEWKARSGGELAVEAITINDLQKSAPLAGDLVIFPSRWLGALAEHSQLRPLRDSLLESPELGLSDIFPAIRNGEMRYGGRTLALPLGSPPLLAFSHPSLAANQPTSHWLPPLAGRAAAYTLIARALSYTESPQRAEALFSAEDMTPRIAAAPFVRALSEISGEATAASVAAPVDFAGGVQAVRAGKAVITLGWPGLARDAAQPAEAGVAEAAVFSPLPVAEQVYSQSQADWENQSFPQPVTLLGVEGRLVGVCRSSRNAVTAFKLCQWLTSGDIAVQLSSRSRGTLWYRASQAGAYARWTGGQAAKESSTPVTKVVAEALAVETPVLIPRVPAIDEYLDVLAEAVRAAEPGEEAATAALSEVSAKWEAITVRLGREGQTRAYRRHLGIDIIEK